MERTLRAVFTNYYGKNAGKVRVLWALHTPTTDRPIEDPLTAVLRASGVNDGDEVQISVSRTGRRPFGGRSVVLSDAGYVRESPAAYRDRTAPPAPAPVPGATWIFVRPNFHALVDNRDAKLVQRLRWYVMRGKAGQIFAQAQHQGKCVLLHRFVWAARGEVPAVPGPMLFRDGHALNCRRANLLVGATESKPKAEAKPKPMNESAPSETNSARYVYPTKSGKFVARAYDGKRVVYLGVHPNRELAERAHSIAVAGFKRAKHTSSSTKTLRAAA